MRVAAPATAGAVVRDLGRAEYTAVFYNLERLGPPAVARVALQQGINAPQVVEAVRAGMWGAQKVQRDVFRTTDAPLLYVLQDAELHRMPHADHEVSHGVDEAALGVVLRNQDINFFHVFDLRLRLLHLLHHQINFARALYNIIE